ncbi:uncharacterized protein (DUF1501 family) [Prosthecobacter fusiformis]|uniref:Uncharacterized protein (DUF1501 family) n=1 Tax=Prosthecobacter fusiformis TaxID=48464 RepID=A0A4R7RZ35_9BACT|nr:DUF1501 domain-containing protein [Prosthecobacter fusiformis]TDU71200.1 uncharacterized protein (DUF1501 family) [Prosthecobacter fusiformis]
MTPNEMPRLLTRRNFLGSSACSAMSTTCLLNTILTLRHMNAQAADVLEPGAPYKAIVCVFLYGGNDSNNVLMPRETSAHAKYAASRTVLTIPQANILALNTLNDNGLNLGLHPSMTGCRDLYNQGKLALLSNVGTLIAPATLQDYYNHTAAVPENLFSHSDQQVQWQTSASTMNAAYTQTGWGARMAEALVGTQERTSVSMLVSLSGTNFFQVGKTMLPFRPGPGGTPVFRLGQGSSSQDVSRYTAFRNILSNEYANLMEDAFADLSSKSIIEADTINAALQGTSNFPTIPANNDLGEQLRTVAKMIQAQGPLGITRQIFFVSTGGFDTHGPQLDDHAGLLGRVSAAMKGFQDGLESIGMGDSVTSFTASDFNRTYDSNGRGSDHGWGGHHLVMGGGVNGQKVYGTYPDPDITVAGNPLDTGRGRWVPTTSVDQYAATMAKWFGLSDSQIREVFPNIINFDANVGFMKAA